MEPIRRSRRTFLSRACLETLESRKLLSTTYYVSPAGNDGNSGTKTSPFATLEHAAGLAQPGTTVIAESGTYAGFSLGLGDNPVTGTAANPVIFEADPTAAPGSVVIDTIWTGFGETGTDAIRIEGAGNAYITVKGFTITNPSSTITGAGIHDDNGNFCTYEYNTVTGMGDWGIFTGFVSNSLFLNNICDASVNQHGMYVSNTCSYDTLQGNTCANNGGCGIHMNGDISEGSTGITTNNLIYDNIIYNNGAAHGGSGLDCDGIQSSTIEDNLFYNNHASGMSLYAGDASQGSTNNLIANNTWVTGNPGRFAINISAVDDTGTDASSGNIIFNNIIYGLDNNLHGAIEIDSASLFGTVSDHNLVYGAF